MASNGSKNFPFFGSRILTDPFSQDDAAHLDPNAVYDWALIATQFIAEYMDLEIPSGAGVTKKSNNGERFS